MKRTKFFSGLFVAVSLVLSAQTAMAQSTIFNIPSTDTVDKGKAYAEFDFLPQAPGFPAYRTTFINPRLVIGAPGNIEVGVNFPTFHNSNSVTYCGSSSTCGYIEPNFKWKFFKNDDEGLAIVGGAVLHTPLNQRTGNDSWGFFYGNFSKKVKTGNYGPRISAGPYVVADKNPVTFTSVGAHRAGAIVGYEQPVHPKVSIVADWYSGKNYYGYFTPGISISLPKSGLFNAGYSIGNDSWANSNATKNRYVFLYYGVTF